MKSAKISVQEDQENLDPDALAEFLALFKGCVVASSKLGVSWNGRGTLPNDIHHKLRQVSPLEWNQFFENKQQDLVAIKSISRQSPLEITFVCVIGLITIAVVLSGGKVAIGKSGIEAELPPLGSGIKTLKKALGLGGKVNPGYSIRTTSIKLNKQEMSILMQQDPSQRNKGGFQNFLIGLQSRVNKNTRVLTLTDVDLDRINRYKANPSSGGYQSRFKKIFGRHFPDNPS